MNTIPSVTDVNAGKTNEIPPTEFHQLYEDWNNTIWNLEQKFPIAAAAYVIFGSIFGFFVLWHLSISAILAGTFLLTISVTAGREIQKNWEAYWNHLLPSVGRVKDFLLRGSI